MVKIDVCRCTVENTWGKDEIVYSIIIKVPPDPPILTVVNSFSESLKLEWLDNKNGGSPILGYVINFKRENGDWEELQIDSKTNQHDIVTEKRGQRNSVLGNYTCLAENPAGSVEYNG